MLAQERFKLNYILRENREETIHFMNAKIAELKLLFQLKYGESRQLDDQTLEMYFFDAIDYYRPILKDYDRDLDLSKMCTEEYMTTVYTHLDVVTKAKYVKEDDFIELLERFLSTWQERFGGIVRNKKATKWLVIRPNLTDANVSEQIKKAKPKWTFPKGKRDFFAETDKECARREILEETGLDLDHKKLGNSITLGVNGTTVKLFIVLNVHEDYLTRETDENGASTRINHGMAMKRKITSYDDSADVNASQDDDESTQEESYNKRKLQLAKRAKVDGWTNVLDDLGLDEKVIRHDLDVLPRRLSVDIIETNRSRFSVNLSNSRYQKRFSLNIPYSDMTDDRSQSPGFASALNNQSPGPSTTTVEENKSPGSSTTAVVNESPGPSSSFSNNKSISPSVETIAVENTSNDVAARQAALTTNDDNDEDSSFRPLPSGGSTSVADISSREVSEVRWMDIRAFYATNYVKLVNKDMQEDYGHARLCASTHKLLTLALESRSITQQVGHELKRGRTIYIKDLKEALDNERRGFFKQ